MAVENETGEVKKHGCRMIRVSLNVQRNKDVLEFWETCPPWQRHNLFAAAIRLYQKMAPSEQINIHERAPAPKGPNIASLFIK